jgi:hypothetical protein
MEIAPRAVRHLADSVPPTPQRTSMHALSKITAAALLAAASVAGHAAE